MDGAWTVPWNSSGPTTDLVVQWSEPLARAAGEGDRAGWVMVADGVVSETGPADFGILGPLEVSRSGCVVPLGGPRQRAVLALLLLEANRVVSMDRGGRGRLGW